MNTDQRWLPPLPAELSDEAAYALYECLLALTSNVEAQYATQIRRHLAQEQPPPKSPLTAPWDRNHPPF